MKNFIIYTTEGTTYGPNEDVPVENCQVLGIIQSHTETAAVDHLFATNKWIHEAGFKKDYVVVKRLHITK